jgi:predicted ArsR family transcriptional regulator
MIADADTKPAAKRPRKMAREPKSEDAYKATPKQESKTKLVLGMLQRPEGATVDQLAVATGWLPHTTRAALTGLKKKGHAVTSDKVEGQGRIYRVVAS